MTTPISVIHRKRFDEIRKSLKVLGYKEMHFLKVELLFYEVLAIAKSYGNSDPNNDLLASLRHLDQNEYKKVTVPTAKRSQRENHIRHFISALKKILSRH